MKSSTNRSIVAMLVVAALAIAFWVLLLSPKREEATKLDGEVERRWKRPSRSTDAEVAEAAEAAEQDFPADYQQLVVLGKAVRR